MSSHLVTTACLLSRREYTMHSDIYTLITSTFYLLLCCRLLVRQLLDLEPQQVRSWTAHAFCIVAFPLIEAVTASIECINLCSALGFIKVILAQTICGCQVMIMVKVTNTAHLGYHTVRVVSVASRLCGGTQRRESLTARSRHGGSPGSWSC